jgi:hypothetical protein
MSGLAHRVATFRAMRADAGGLIGLATDFGLGEALVAGKIASHPAVMRFGSRVANEGGGDVDAHWARPVRA